MEIQWVTPAGNINTIQESVTYSFQLVALSTLPVTFKVLAGNLPAGLRLSSTGLISGTPHEVADITEFKFVIRASTSVDIADRTFTLIVEGADEPQWVTPSGFLPMGVLGTEYVLDNSYVDFQLEATDSDTTAGNVLTYRLLPNAGQFPPGLTLSPTGRITGFTQPILALNFDGVQAGYDTTPWDTLPLDIVTDSVSGFDDYSYDIDTYDFSEVDTNPVRLNRVYTFSVEASDGTTSISRMFKIYIITDDFLIQNNISYHRVPYWITEPYLGRFRANNKITIPLEVYDPPTLPGLISFSVVNVSLPDWLILDTHAGTLQGSIPKQNAVTTRHQFTIKATKFHTTFETPTFKVVGDWNAVTAYTTSQAVRYRDPKIDNGDTKLYICIKDNINVKPNYDEDIDKQIYTDYWYVTAPVDLVYGVTYFPYQAVRYEYEIYICKEKNSIASENEIPKLYNQNLWYTNSVFSTRTFTVDVIGEIESSIEWVTPADLGSILPYHDSTLHLEAISLLADAQVSVELKSGSLPKGLSLLPNGNIIGKAEDNNRFYDIVNGVTTFDITFDAGYTTFNRTYKFTVTAHDATNLSAVDRTFTLKVADPNPTKYCNLYVKAFLSKEQRNEWYNFITDSNLFKANEFYRPGDVNYGVQTELRTLIYAGVENSDIVNFVQAVSRNHNKKQMLFGDIKYATAYDPSSKEPIYEVVYVEIIDDIAGISTETSQDLSDDLKAKILTSVDTITIDSDIPYVSDSDKQQVFPNSIENMRARIANSGAHTSTYLPAWMTGIYSAGYASVVVLCYVKPGNAPNVLARIKAKLHTASRGAWNNQAAYQIGDTVSYLGFYYTCAVNNTNSKPSDNSVNWSRNFEFKALNFTADRYVIDAISDQIADKYLAFPNNREN
jgi:hypothetical protein